MKKRININGHELIQTQRNNGWHDWRFYKCSNCDIILQKSEDIESIVFFPAFKNIELKIISYTIDPVIYILSCEEQIIKNIIE